MLLISLHQHFLVPLERDVLLDALRREAEGSPAQPEKLHDGVAPFVRVALRDREDIFRALALELLRVDDVLAAGLRGGDQDIVHNNGIRGIDRSAEGVLSGLGFRVEGYGDPVNSSGHRSITPIRCRRSPSRLRSFFMMALVRLTNLIPEILQMVDEKKIAFRPAVEISYLTKDEQEILLDIMQYNESTPSLAQAILMKKQSQDKTLTEEKIEEVMSEEKPNQIEKIKINKSKIENVIPKNIVTQNEIEDFIVMCIQEHNKKQRQKENLSR